jgi:hypothetical protein
MSVEKKAQLLKDWIKFKKAEDSAEKKRVEIEREIEALYGTFDGKSKTFSDEDLGFKTTIKKNETVKFTDSWETVRKSVPSDMRPEKVKFSVDSPGLLFLKEHHEDVYKTVSDCIIVTPGKTSITVTKI